MQVHTCASTEIPAAPERVFDLLVDYGNCAQFFRRWGPIPGVVSCVAIDENGDGRPRRKLKLTDGSTHEEEILVLERPHCFRYRWLNAPAAPLNLVICTAETRWDFQEIRAGGGTRVIWTYHFEVTSPFAYPAALVLRALFNRWMVQALRRLGETSLDARGSASR
jgi:uncharacterized protein YndB with AHSA1/START domain